MIDFTPEEKAILIPEYEKYLANNERHRLYNSKIGWPMSFDDWFRAMADEAKDRTKYQD